MIKEMNITKQTFKLNKRYHYDSDDMTLASVELNNENSIILNKNENALMIHLLSNYPNIVYRQDMLKYIWRERHVGENSLNVVVSQLRTKLKQVDPELKNCLVTAQGEGYRWRGDVENISQQDGFLPTAGEKISNSQKIPLSSFPIASHYSMMFLSICLVIAILLYR